jgi:hypothetical protein
MSKEGHYEAIVESHANYFGRICCLRPNPEGQGEEKCCNCLKDIRFDNPPAWEKIKRVACSRDCAIKAGFYPSPRPRRRS